MKIRKGNGGVILDELGYFDSENGVEREKGEREYNPTKHHERSVSFAS